ncbi:MAG: outer membrane beta-barrel protein [Bacteroides sp.]|nr:outer membrane beta-barrel protein [Bacteroides sp.]
MKKFLLSLAAVLGLGFAANAIGPSIYVGYGGYTQMDATNMHDGVGKVKNAWGALNAGVDFKVLPKLSVGPSYSFSSTTTKGSDINVYYHAIMVNAKYDYMSLGMFKMYAHVGAGAEITHIGLRDREKNKGYFAFQVSPICVSADVANKVALFGELGFGAQGLLNVGVRVGL